MRRTHPLLTALLIGLATLTGCLSPSVWTPEAQHVAARDTFNATVKALTVAIDAGEFSDAEALTILELVLEGRKALNAWETTLTSHTPPEDQIAQYAAILARLDTFERKRKEPH